MWLVVSLFCQWRLERRWPNQSPLYVWAAADAVLLTWLLSFIEPPLGVFIGGYFLLIAVAGLSASTRLVTFTTAACMLMYLVLLFVRRPDAPPLHYAVFAEMTMALAGLAVGYQVWRMNVLRDYYGDRAGA